MGFKFATFDPARDPDDYNPAFPPPQSPSPSVTLCQPCEITCTLTRAVVSRLVAAGASLVFTATAIAFDGREIQDESAESAETQVYCISSDVPPEFHQRQLKEFTLKELKAATQKFSNEKVIGEGGFGQVYEGQLSDGSLVAIKRLASQSMQGITEFKAEVMIGSIVPPHRNLLPLLGICRAKKGKELLLVYPLMINKSAAWCLRERPDTQPPMDWPTRRKIAAGVARGLSHLHDLNIVHRDIKASNIMLNEDFEPHIGDFGLARVIDHRRWGYSVDRTEEAPTLPRTESEEGSHGRFSHVTTLVRGTYGYIAPEYMLTSQCSLMTDVFAFGILLMELVTGERAFDSGRGAKGEDAMLLDRVRGHMQHGRIETLAYPYMRCECERAEIEKIIKLALLCAQSDPSERPNMAEVVPIIEGHSIDKRWEEYCHREERWTQVVTINESDNDFTSLFDPKNNPDLELPLM